MKVEIWSDILCPFCYIGKRHFGKALEKLEYADQLEIVWKSYQLNPDSPEKVEESYSEYLAKKKNISEQQVQQMLSSVVAMAKDAGLDYHLDRTVMTNSYKAHLLIQLAKTKGLGDEMEESLFKGYFTDGKNISDVDTLVELGASVGLSKEEVVAALADDNLAYNLKIDLDEAAQIGVTGVPFFVMNRKYGISGAQPVEVFINSIDKAYQDWKGSQSNTIIDVSQGNSCSVDGQCD